MGKRSGVLSVLAAFLVVGLVLGVVAWMNNGSAGGGKVDRETVVLPVDGTETEAERVTVVTNATAKYGYRQNDAKTKTAYLAYSDELKPNTRYSIVFNYYESDYSTWLEKIGLEFNYAYDLKLPEAGDGFGNNLVINGGMKPGSYYDFQTDENGTFILRLLIGPYEDATTEDGLAKIQSIADYIKANIPFQICEIVG